MKFKQREGRQIDEDDGGQLGRQIRATQTDYLDTSQGAGQARRRPTWVSPGVSQGFEDSIRCTH